MNWFVIVGITLWITAFAGKLYLDVRKNEAISGTSKVFLYIAILLAAYMFIRPTVGLLNKDFLEYSFTDKLIIGSIGFSVFYAATTLVNRILARVIILWNEDGEV